MSVASKRVIDATSIRAERSCVSARPQLKRELVSKARIQLDQRKSVRPLKGIFCDDISEFESYMPSHAVGLSQVRSPAIVMHRVALDYGH
jgi:hypothetical protein